MHVREKNNIHIERERAREKCFSVATQLIPSIAIWCIPVSRKDKKKKNNAGPRPLPVIVQLIVCSLSLSLQTDVAGNSCKTGCNCKKKKEAAKVSPDAGWMQHYYNINDTKTQSSF